MKKHRLSVLVIIFLVSIPYSLACIDSDNIIQPVFSINLLSPNDDDARNQFSILIQENLPKIGIRVKIHESTTWENIAPRVWDYIWQRSREFDYIPTYEQGGYDALFLDISWDLDWDPGLLYDSSFISWRLLGANFYQYHNIDFMSLVDQYLAEENPVLRSEYAHELQSILYEDLPAICIVYPRDLYGFNDRIIGVDSLLLSVSRFRAENWDDPSDHIINYAIPEKMKVTNVFNGNMYDSKMFYDNQWINAVYGSLLQRGQNHHGWEQVIASNISLSLDKKNYTVVIDDTAKFSDGNPVLAEDVKYSCELLYMTPAVNSVYYGYLYGKLASNDSIQIINPHTLTFNFTRRFVFPLDIFSFGIVDKSSIEPVVATYGYSIFEENPLTGNVQDVLVKSCGPFVLANYSSTEIKLVPNQYWSDLSASDGVEPKLDELNIQYYEDRLVALDHLINGLVDIYDGGFGGYMAEFMGAPNIIGEQVESLTHQELALNLKHPVFGTGELTPKGTQESAKAIRKAISHIIPRQIIVEEIYGGLAAPGVAPWPEGCIGFYESLEPYEYNLTLAINYMKNAGYTSLTDPCITTKTNFDIPIFILSVVGLSCYIIFRKDLKK